jgi:Cytochrome P450
MHAALARDGAVVAEGLPGPAFARHMLSVDPPDHTRLRRLTSAAFSRPRIAALGHVSRRSRRLLDDLEACGDTVVDLVKGFAFPLPFTVISELLGVPEPDRDHLGAGSPRCSHRRRRPSRRPRPWRPRRTSCGT